MLTKRCRNWGTKSESLSLVGDIEHGSRLIVHRRASSIEVQLKAAGLTKSLEEMPVEFMNALIMAVIACFRALRLIVLRLQPAILGEQLPPPSIRAFLHKR
jgi:hypothetical protein